MNVVTATCSFPHCLKVGDEVLMHDPRPWYVRAWRKLLGERRPRCYVIAVPDPLTYTYEEHQ